MKVIVFGATGQTGQELVKRLVADGHTVSAVTRTAGSIDTLGGKVSEVVAQVREYEDVRRAVSGQEVVFDTLSQRSIAKDDLQTAFVTNLVAAMEAEQVKRLIVLSALGAGDSKNETPLGFRLVGLIILRNLYFDKNRAEEVITHSQLDYTLVRPGRLENGPGMGSVRAGLTRGNIKLSISRTDVAAFMADQLSTNEWLRKAPIIGH